MKSSRMDMKQITCDPCRFSGKTSSPAKKYCKDCGGHFCMYCAKTHVRTALTKTHEIIDVDKRSRTTEVARNSTTRFQNKCHDHGADLVSYCEPHDSLCCNVCVMSVHKDCKRVVKLSEAASGNKAKVMCKDLESTIKKLQAQFSDIQSQRRDHLQYMDEQNDAIMSSIRMFRKSINGIVDRLEDCVVRQKNEYWKDQSNLLTNHMKTCQTAATVLDDAYRNLDISLQHTDAGIFVNIKRVESVVRKYSEVLAKLQPSPGRENFRFLPDLNIEKFLSSLEGLGVMKVEALPIKGDNLSLASSRRSREDSRRPNLTTDLNVKLKSDKRTCFITGVSFMHDGRIVLADDANKKIKLFGADFKPLSNICTDMPPRDISAISHHEVAVTIPNEKTIQVYKVGPKEFEKKLYLRLDIECYGITYYEPDIYVTSGWSSEREIQVIDLSGEVKRKIRLPRSIFRYPLYITIDPKSKFLFVSDYVNGVICLDMSGKVILQCQEPEAGSYYKGLTVAIPGQIYACIWQQNGVSRVHTDGRGLESVLTWLSADRRKPLAIAYTSKTKRLVLSFCGEKRDLVSVYKFY